MTPVRLEPAASWSRVNHFTSEPLRSLKEGIVRQSDSHTTQLFSKITIDFLKYRTQVIFGGSVCPISNRCNSTCDCVIRKQATFGVPFYLDRFSGT